MQGAVGWGCLSGLSEGSLSDALPAAAREQFLMLHLHGLSCSQLQTDTHMPQPDQTTVIFHDCLANGLQSAGCPGALDTNA